MRSVLTLLCLFVAFPVFSASKFPGHLVRLHDALEECAGNGSGFLKRYDVRQFSVAKIMAKMKAEDGSCERDHTYSKSKEHVSRMFSSTIRRVYLVRECLNEFVAKAKVSEIGELMKREDNLGVFASEVIENPLNSEACLYFHYDIYMKNGIVMRVTFDYTD